jgi:1-acyl-sn-glycerol-3-phosphate acyltransferase
MATPFPIKYITTYEMFRKPVTGYLFRKLNTIPKKRYKSDFQTGREIYKWIRKGAVIGIFPEGERTWTGKMIPLKQETLNLFRKFPEVPLLPVVLEGNFHAWPRWGSRFRRAKIVITFQPAVKIDPGEDKDLFAKRLESLIRPNDQDDLSLFCKSPKRVEDISKIFYRCPECHSFQSLRPKNTNTFECSVCNQQYELDSYYNVQYEKGNRTRIMGFDEFYECIRIRREDIRMMSEALIPKTIQSALKDPILALQQEVEVDHEIEGRFSSEGKGWIALTRDFLVLHASKEKFNIKLQSITSVTIESNRKLQVYEKGRANLYQVVFHEGSVKMWQDLLVELLNSEYNIIPNTR